MRWARPLVSRPPPVRRGRPWERAALLTCSVERWTIQELALGGSRVRLRYWLSMLVVATGMAFASPAAAAAAVVGQWNMDEQSGTTAFDSSGNGHNGTLTNVADVSAVTADPDLANNTSTLVTDVGPAAHAAMPKNLPPNSFAL